MHKKSLVRNAFTLSENSALICLNLTEPPSPSDCDNLPLNLREAPYCWNFLRDRRCKGRSCAEGGVKVRAERFHLESEFGLPPVGDPSPRPPSPQPPGFPPQPDEPQLPPPDPEPELPGFPEPGEKLDLRCVPISRGSVRGCAYFRRAGNLLSPRILHRTLLTLNYLVNV